MAALFCGAAQAQPADLQTGGVFTMSNAPDGNMVVAFGRQADGRLVRIGEFPTGGAGSGSFEDAANGLVLGTAQGEASPNNHIEQAELLFAVNPRSNSITTFRITPGGLERVAVQPSGGKKPVSLTLNRGVLYVLHSAEATDDLIDSGGHIIPNCTTGTPSITGFRVAADGRLVPIEGSTRRLSGLGGSGCAQASFTPDGRVLVVTERLAKEEGPPGPMGDEGVIVTFTRNADGTLSEAPRVTEATGSGPFGFTFSKQGELYVTEQFDGPGGPALGAVAGYRVGGDGALTPTSASVKNGGTDTCWFVVTDDGRFGYASSFFGGGRITSYSLQGGLRVIKEDESPAVKEGAADLALSRDSRFLYQLGAFDGRINVFAVTNDGRLQLVQTVEGAGASPMAARSGLAAF